MPRRFNQRLYLALVLGFLLIAGSAACGKREKERAKTGGGTVVVGILSEPNSLNPLVAASAESQDIVSLMFLKLLDEEPDFLHFKPRLADTWEFSPDSLEITFHLRSGAVWQNGERVTADDVRFTWELQTDSVVAWASRKLKDRIERVDVLDDLTVRFRFTNRYPEQLMDANDGVILPKHALETLPRDSIRTAAFGRHPIGDGPYRLSRWVPGQYVELERNPSYYEEGRPKLDRIVFRIVPDMTNLVTQLKTGEIDCLESIPTDALKEIQSSQADVRIYHYISRGMTFVAWNLQNELFQNREVRRALAMAVNTDEVIQTVWNGMAEPLDSPMHPMLWAHDPSMKPIAYDPDRARAILADEGWLDRDGDGVLEKDGRRFEFDMTTNQGVAFRADIITMIQEYYRKIGIKVNPRVLEWNTFIQGVVKGDFDSAVLGWRVPTRADLSTFWNSTAVPPRGFNASRYVNPEVDALMFEARNTLDVARARSLWYRCQRIIFDDQPILFLAVPYEVVGVNKRVCGIEPNSIGFYVNVPDWYIGADCSQ